MKAQVSHVQQVHAVHDAPFNHLGGLSRPPPSATACFQGVSDLSDAASPSPHERLSEKGNGGLAGKGGGGCTGGKGPQLSQGQVCPGILASPGLLRLGGNNGGGSGGW